MTTMVDDPQYLALPYIKTYQYKKQRRRHRMGADAVRRALSAASHGGLRPPGSRPPASKSGRGLRPGRKGLKSRSRPMDPLSGEYPLTQLERVVFGAGSVARLGDEVERLGASRAVVVTGRTLGASPLLDRVTGALGSALRPRLHRRPSARAVDGGGRPRAGARRPPRRLRGELRRRQPDRRGKGAHLRLASAGSRAPARRGADDAVGRGVHRRRRASPTRLAASSTPSSIRVWRRASSCSIPSSRRRRRDGCGPRPACARVNHAVETLYADHRHPVSGGAGRSGAWRCWPRTWAHRSTRRRWTIGCTVRPRRG